MKWTEEQLTKVAKRAYELDSESGSCEHQEAKDAEYCACTAQAFLRAFQEVTWDSKTPEERTQRIAHAVASYFRPGGTPKHYADNAVKVHAQNLFPIVQRELRFAPERAGLEQITEIAKAMEDSENVEWTAEDKSLDITFELSAAQDLSDQIKIKLKVDGSWEYVREVDDGRDPYNRDMTEPYEP